MAITHRQHRGDEDETTVARTAIKFAQKGARGGWLATAFSAVAVGLSCFSVYVTTLQGAKLEVYVPPAIQYGRDAGGDTELFAIPITIANAGARSGTVLAMELEVRNLKSNSVKRYHSAFLGEHPREASAPNRQFAPLSIPGRGVFSETVRFYPSGAALPRLVDAEGEYDFHLRLNTATPLDPTLLDRLQGRVEPAPVHFQMSLPWISDQQLGFRRATIAMYAKGWMARAVGTEDAAPTGGQ
jgi:hypothetical protein